MKRRIINTIISNLIVLFIVITLNFFLPRLIFDDPCTPYYIGVPEDALLLREQIREEYGFNKPIIVQYFLYLGRVFTFDFGYSYQYKESVLQVMFSRVPWSIFLNLTILIIAVPLGILIGSKCAKNRGKKLDSIILKLNSLQTSIPTFWLALLVVLLLAFIIPIFPYSGAMTPGYSLNVNWQVFLIVLGVMLVLTIITYIIFKKFVLTLSLTLFSLYLAMVCSIPFADTFDIIYHSVLPLFVVAIGSILNYSLSVRNYMLGVCNEDYIEFARAKGMPENRILYRHTFKNALLPLVTSLGMNFVGIFSGSVLIEQIFSWPGMGELLVEANNTGDYQLAQAILLFFAIITIVANTITDFIYHKLDPRVGVR